MESELSRTAAEQGDSELGLRYARQAVATFRELGDNESLMTALERVADHTISMRRLDEALEAVDEAIALADIVAAPPPARRLFRTLGHIHGAAGEANRPSWPFDAPATCCRSPRIASCSISTYRVT